MLTGQQLYNAVFLGEFGWWKQLPVVRLLSRNEDTKTGQGECAFVGSSRILSVTHCWDAFRLPVCWFWLRYKFCGQTIAKIGRNPYIAIKHVK